MRRISKKRESQHKEYDRVKKELFLEDFKNNKLVCFLSNLPMRIPEEIDKDDDKEVMKILDIHHIEGERENDHLYDREILKPVIRNYHTMYHSFTVEQLLRYEWYHKYLNRIKNSHPNLYDKEMNKHEKR